MNAVASVESSRVQDEVQNPCYCSNSMTWHCSTHATAAAVEPVYLKVIVGITAPSQTAVITSYRPGLKSIRALRVQLCTLQQSGRWATYFQRHQTVCKSASHGGVCI